MAVTLRVGWDSGCSGRSPWSRAVHDVVSRGRAGEVGWSRGGAKPFVPRLIVCGAEVYRVHLIVLLLSNWNINDNQILYLF